MSDALPGGMKHCPYCGYSNYVQATECRKCQASFVAAAGTLHRQLRYGPEKAHAFRNQALSIFALGLLIKVYWGGYGPWPVIDYPFLTSLRTWLEPLLLFGGILMYGIGWVLKYV